ncbi:MAG: hypothetical protein J2P25_19685 [Nocardiopsaceae bacterium]|nr:hypothetical protein [Nocardiopsaceae bacterium]
MRSQPPPDSPPTQFSPYLTQLKKYMPRPRTLPPILALVFGASTLKIFFNWQVFDRLADIRTVRYPSEQWQSSIRPQLPPEELIKEPFPTWLCLAHLKDVDGLRDLAGFPWAAANAV